MLRVKKILWPTDFWAGAERALAQALGLARRFQAELHMLHAIILHGDDPHHPAHHFPNLEEMQNKLKSLAGAHMEEMIAAHRLADLRLKTVQVRGLSAAAAILEYAKEQDVDLIVMGTHGRRSLGHLFLGSVAEEVVRLSSCPVMTVRQVEQEKPAGAFKKILVPVDFSSYSRHALIYAREIAAAFQARLQLVHVIEEAVHPSFYLRSSAPLLEVLPKIKTAGRHAMEQMLSETAGPQVEADLHLLEGHAGRDLVKFAASQGTDLIVIATHGLTGIEHFLIGSTTEKVVRLAPMPVFTIKAFGKSLL